jgi:tetratricopeptide (TPR) repeat protein
MIPRSCRPRFCALRIALLLALLTAPLSLAFAQKQSTDDPETAALRKQALDLYRSGKFVEAMPLLEKLSGTNPQDFVVKEHWAYSVLEYSATLKDPAQRRSYRIHARELALEAQKGGDQSDLMQVLLSIPADGSEPKFSEREDVDNAMRSAEASFARGDYDNARAGYQHVLELDPKNYEAALFIGDSYFNQKIYDRAGEWFERAVAINPDKETAYHYWGDALAAAGRNSAAREKYINAVVAEPYTRASWAALRNWTDRTQQPFNAIILENKSPTKKASDKGVSLEEHSLKEEGPEAAGWAAYDATRQAWKDSKFRKEFPNEPKYRRTLKEETEALDAMVTVLAPDAASMKKAEKLDTSLLALVRLDQDGLLEAFVLLNRADREIALDYPAYLKLHRDKLYKYVDEIVLPRDAGKSPK